MGWWRHHQRVKVLKKWFSAEKQNINIHKHGWLFVLPPTQSHPHVLIQPVSLIASNYQSTQSIVNNNYCLRTLHKVSKFIPVVFTVTEAVPLTPPTLALQVYCPAWDSRSGLIVRVLLLMVKSPLVVMTFELPGLIHSTVGSPTIPLEMVTLHVRLYCWPRTGIFPLVTNTSSVYIVVGGIKGRRLMLNF